VIVRIMGEGQLDVAEGDLAALDSGDEDKFRTALHALLEQVRAVGKTLPAEDLAPSGLILPPADATMEEVRAMLGDAGLIPD
jgi:hypothetical protein